MRLKVLVDNNTYIDHNYFMGEPALSFYIENENDKILFDTGYTDIFMRNAEKMNIDLSKVNKIVFSPLSEKDKAKSITFQIEVGVKIGK